jgi:hypothetical protein
MMAPTSPSPTLPRLAVVGHPNKGKSSLVATLAHDDSVVIGPHPGTTLVAREYPMRVDGVPLYVLIDTPGFQRARAVLAELERRARETNASAADRPRLVAEFLAAPGQRERFPDECELLRPIVAGAGILYVVDGGVPYGPQYEAEMEILRWTGRPSLAVINPISSRDHVAEWEAALGQFFRIVRVVDAVRADAETQAGLLRAFAELEAGWRAPIEAALAAQGRARDARREQTARAIAEWMADALVFSVERRIGPDEPAERHREALAAEYRAALGRRERAARERVQAIHGHPALEARAEELALLEADLFSEGAWLAFGLTRRDLVTAGAAGGAATGGVVDLALGGASLLLGVATGAAVGGVLGFLGADRMPELKLIDRPLGGRLVRYGPARSLNFPFVLLGRARLHARLLARRTHAMRDPLAVESAPAAGLPLEAAFRHRLERDLARLRGAGGAVLARAEAIQTLAGTLSAILAADDSESGSEA